MWSRAPNFPMRSSGGPNFIMARVSNLPILSSKGPKLMFHRIIRGPIFRFAPHCFLRTKCPKLFIAPSRTPNFPSGYQGIPIYHCVIASSRGLPMWPIISHHVIKGSCLSFASSRGPHFPHRVIKGTQISKIHHVYNLWDMYRLTLKEPGGGRNPPRPRHFLLYLSRLLFFRAETSWLFFQALRSI